MTRSLVYCFAAALCLAFSSVAVHGWEYTLPDSGTPYKGLIMARPDPNSAFGYVCFNPLWTDSNAVNIGFDACTSLGYPIPATYPAFTFGDSSVAGSGSPFYFAQLNCPSAKTKLDGCVFIQDAPGCAQAMGVDCSATTFGGPTPLPTVGPEVFTMRFNPNQTAQSVTDVSTFDGIFSQAIVTYFQSHKLQINSSRIHIEDTQVYTEVSGFQFQVIWDFNYASSVNDVARGVLQEAVALDYSSVFPVSLNLTYINIAMPPNVPQPTPPANTSSWTFRLTGGYVPWVGRLEVMPGPGSDWGTVCSINIDATAALAACRSVGYMNPSPRILPVDALTPPSQGVIVMSEVNCSITELLLGECGFIYSTPTSFNAPASCTHAADLWLDCFWGSNSHPPVPSNDTYPPQYYSELIAWSAIVNNSFYGAPVISNITDFNTNLLNALANYIICPIHRIAIISEVQNVSAMTTNVTFVFTPAMSLNELPRMEYDIVLQETGSQVLNTQLGILLLLSNATVNYTDPNAGEDMTDGPYVFQLSESTQRGHVGIRPKNVGGLVYPMGSICSMMSWGALEAAATCRSLNYTFDRAGAIPFFGGAEGFIYFADVDCSKANATARFPECMFRFFNSDEAEITSNCTNSEDAGVICSISRMPVAGTAFNARVTTYTVTVITAGFSTENFYQQFNALFPIHPDRLIATNSTVQADPTYTTFEFFFSDNDRVETPRDDYEYMFESINADGLRRLFGIMQVTSRVGPPNLGPTTKPFQWQNTTGWQWRILGGQDIGLLEVLPYGESQWGTVCSTDFGIQEASAACHTLGYKVQYGTVATSNGGGQGIGPIYMSEVWCPDPSSEYYLQNCSFEYNLTTNLGCTHAQDVYLDCTGNMSLPTMSPRSFISVVKTTNYTDAYFKSRWALYFNMSTDRIVIANTIQYKDFSYVNWTVIDDNSTIRVPTGGGGGGGGSTLLPPGAYNGSQAFIFPPFAGGSHLPEGFSLPGGSFGSGFVPELNLGTLPSELLELIITMTYDGTLWDYFRIYEQRDNLTTPSGPVDPNVFTWRLYLEAVDEALTDRFGRVMLQPGADAMVGTACSYGTDQTAALTICRTRIPTEGLATLIPYFRPYHGGVIYLSNVHCNDTTRVDKCDYVASTQFEKNNPCTHLQDVGVLCGRAVVDDPAQPITYLASWSPNRLATNVSNLLSCISGITNIPLNRFVLTSSKEVGSGDFHVNFTFSPTSTNKNISATMITRGDCDLILQNTNEWAMETYCGVTTITYSAVIVMPPTSDVPMPTDTAFPLPPTTHAGGTTSSPVTLAPGKTSAPVTSVPQKSTAPATLAPGKTQVPATKAPVTLAPGKTDVPATMTPATLAPGKTDVPATMTPATLAPGQTDVPATMTPATLAPGQTDLPSTNAPPTATPTTLPPPTTAAPPPPQDVSFVTSLNMTSQAMESLLEARVGPCVVSPTPIAVTATNKTFLVTFPNRTLAATAIVLANTNSLPDVMAAAMQAAPPVGSPSDTSSKTPLIAGAVAGGVAVTAVLAFVVYKVFVAKASSGASAYGDAYVNLNAALNVQELEAI